MAKDYGTKILFSDENKVLESAKEILKRFQGEEHELWSAYGELVHQYEKLLKVTAKIFKISDIQGRVLKDQESRIKRTNESLRRMEESRRRLFSDISHELGTPMTTLQGYVRAMLDKVIIPDEHHLELIYDKIMLVNQLVEDLFELSKLESGRIKFDLKQIMLEELVDGVIHKFGPDIEERGFRFVAVPPADLPAAFRVALAIDPVRIEQVLNNLVYNAVKYTPEGGTIGIQFALQHSAAQGEFIIKVTDTGPGIDECSLPHIFDRFYQGGRAQKSRGAGLGLAIAKQIVLRHGGQIGVESRPDQGSVFYFSLPVRLIPRSEKIL